MSDPRRGGTAFDAKLFMSFVRNLGHGGALGIDYRDHGADWAELALPYEERLIGVVDTGVIASGPIISLMDMASAVAVSIRAGLYRPQATLDLRVDYLRPAAPGKGIVGRAECYGMTRSVAFVRGFAHDGDASDLVANVTGTFMFTD